MAKSVTVTVQEPTGGFQELCRALGVQAARKPAAMALDGTDDLKQIITTIEREVIERVMRKVRGNQVQGARLLNISRGALIAKTRAYGIPDYRQLRKQDEPVSSPPRRVPSSTPRRRRRRSSPKLHELRVLQGRFLGALRGLPPEKREEIKKLRDEKGYQAALKIAAHMGE